MTAFAFAGRCSTEDLQDPEASRNWQLNRARALIEPVGGRIVAEYFDIGHSRSLPWRRRPQASALLDALKNPDRGFTAVVIGEPQRVLYDNQYSLTHPLFTHYGVELWVPEVGGPINADSEAHDLVMSVFGGMSKGERNRIKVRVRAAMAAQAQIEGRFLGGRPPYGYRIVDAGPHPNPAKATDGKRLHRLEPDPTAAHVVRRIFAEFLRGRGYYAIAEGLTRDDIPCPSAHDPGRNPHRSGEAWAKNTVRAILLNPRYTGHQVWNRQHKQEIKHPAHPPLITMEDYLHATEIRTSNTRGKGPKERRAKVHTYVLAGRVHCPLCQRKMISHSIRAEPYYRCRYAEEYALANKITHPRNIFLRERDVLPALDEWISLQFAPGHRETTIDRLHAAQRLTAPEPTEETEAILRDCDRKLTNYRNLLDSGATDSATVAQWVTETEARRKTAAARLQEKKSPGLTSDQISKLVHAAGDIADAL